MSDLTNETKTRAEELHVPYQKSARISYCLRGWHPETPSIIQGLIDFLEKNKHLPNLELGLIEDSSTDSWHVCDPEVYIEYTESLSEEQVLKGIAHKENENNIRRKEKELAALSREERLKVEIAILERNLKRKKKALGQP